MKEVLWWWRSALESLQFPLEIMSSHSIPQNVKSVNFALLGKQTSASQFEQLKDRDGWHGKIEVDFSLDEIAVIGEVGAPYQEFLIPAEVSNQYGLAIDVTDDEEELNYFQNRGI